MVIDAREIGAHEILTKLKKIFEEYREKEVDIKILIKTQSDAKRIKAFSTMSGYNANVEVKNGYFATRITGISCGCV
ncbi:MAG: hypothetical protein NTW44_00185 [Nitrospirae bacterium]|nr:hypothetical protein [Nitrospirota bacterium]